MVLNSKKTISKNVIDFFCRIFISSLFISAIPSKITNFTETVDYISSKGIPEFISPILLIGAIISLTLGSGFLVFSKEKNLGAIFLLVFLIPVTVIFHLYPFQEKAFLINLGYLLILVLSNIQ